MVYHFPRPTARPFGGRQRVRIEDGNGLVNGLVNAAGWGVPTGPWNGDFLGWHHDHYHWNFQGHWGHPHLKSWMIKWLLSLLMVVIHNPLELVIPYFQTKPWALGDNDVSKATNHPYGSRRLIKLIQCWYWYHPQKCSWLLIHANTTFSDTPGISW